MSGSDDGDLWDEWEAGRVPVGEVDIIAYGGSADAAPPLLAAARRWLESQPPGFVDSVAAALTARRSPEGILGELARQAGPLCVALRAFDPIVQGSGIKSLGLSADAGGGRRRYVSTRNNCYPDPVYRGVRVHVSKIGEPRPRHWCDTMSESAAASRVRRGFEAALDGMGDRGIRDLLADCDDCFGCCRWDDMPARALRRWDELGRIVDGTGCRLAFGRPDGRGTISCADAERGGGDSA